MVRKFTEWKNIKYFTSYKEIYNTDSESCCPRDCGIFLPNKKYWIIVEIFVFFWVSLSLFRPHLWRVCCVYYVTVQHIFKSLQFAEAGDEKKFEKILDKFSVYFIPKRNIIHERARFHQRAQ